MVVQSFLYTQRAHTLSGKIVFLLHLALEAVSSFDFTLELWHREVLFSLSRFLFRFPIARVNNIFFFLCLFFPQRYVSIDGTRLRLAITRALS